MDFLGKSPRTIRSLALLFPAVAAGGCTLFTPRSSEAEFEKLMEQRARRAQGVVAPVESQKPKTTITDMLDIDEMGKSISKSVIGAAGYGPNKNIAQQTFDAAEQKYLEASELEGDKRRALFATAAAEFGWAAYRWPDSALQEDSFFKAGESYFFADEYSSAAGEYEKLLKAYPNS